MALSDKNDWADGILSEVETQRDPTEVYTMSKEDLEGELMEEAAEAMVELEIAKEYRKTWARRRKTGARKLGASAQSFLSNASAFIASYSGIVELVKAADQQYGGLAYGTLSLFLSVAVMKEQQEETIENGLKRLSLEFPRLEILAGIYPSRQMQRLIGDVYKDGIDFARECARYYTRSSAGRLGRIMKTPLKPINRMVDSISEHLAEMRKESEVLMQTKIHEILRKNHELKRELSTVLAELKGARERVDEINLRALKSQQDQDAKNLSKLVSILQTGRLACYMDKDKHKRLLDDTFVPKAYNAKQSAPVLMSQSELSRDKEYQAWATCETSQLLLLSGRNWAGMRNQTTLNWLSPAVSLVLDQHQDSNKLVAYYFCQSTYRVREGGATPFNNIVAGLIYQISCKQRHILRSGELLQTLQDSFANEEDPVLSDEAHDSAVCNLCDHLLKVLNSLDDGTETILILDRIDECRLGQDILDPKEIIAGFARVVRAAKGVVKVFAVMDSSNKSCEISSRFRDKINKGDKIFSYRPNWDQESLRARRLNQ
ncbi:MAG: hypothetical protein M1839_004464 [Geoglossum umbratile]|nr:MAG: hypothetical protein M1839_004464 [Geoglossum umbratile]